ncbi:bifunctional protein FolD [Clostridium sp. CAG:557]|nr:bifunctional protein FolD [Clostridium sp. CAG:557]
MTNIINGKEISDKFLKKLKKEVCNLKTELNLQPALAVIIVGDDPASKIYVRNKKRACEEIGIKSIEFALPTNTSENELLNLIDALNKRPDVNGILVQMPLPPHINEKIIIAHINPIKDVDAFHETNVGKIMIGNFKFLPCTPAGIIHLLDESNIEISSKHCVIIGRSNIVGKPLAMLMLHRDATVTICHSKTKNLTEICKTADILIAAVGKVNFVTSNMVKPGAVVVDVGINRCENGKICGDVDFEHVKNIASYITPVPGGVGPMTISMLMKNTITAALMQKK